MWVALMRVVLAALVVAVVVLGLGHALFGWRPWRRPFRRVTVWWEGRKPEPPATRPVQELAVLARRLGRRVHHPPPGQRFVKCEAVRQAYDAVLAETCLALGVTHLLMVLPPGPELDAERARVEGALELAGFELGLPL
jgi:hypothetical protein